MNIQRHALSIGISTVLGTSLLVAPGTSLAGLFPDGSYQIQILPTPTRATAYGATAFKITPPTGLESSFTFGNLPDNTGSQGMTDNATLVTSANVGSGVAGDGLAGTVDIVVSGDNFTVTGMQVDTIFQTAGGSFAQYFTPVLASPCAPADPLCKPPLTDGVQGYSFADMAGTIDNNGIMTFSPTGRIGAIDGPVPDLVDRRWNVDDTAGPSTTWNSFTTESATAGTTGTINGVRISNVGPTLNGDAFDDFSGTLVNAGRVGKDWDTFNGVGFFEVWKVNIVSVSVGANLAPVISMSAMQNGVEVVFDISNNGADGDLTVDSNAVDNGGSPISSYDWTVGSPSSCATTPAGTTNSTVAIDASGCTAGDIITAMVDVSDGIVTSTATKTYHVTSALPNDPDVDGVPDNGTDLSPNDASVLQTTTAAADGEAQASTGSLQLGLTALCAGTNGIRVTDADVLNFAAAGCTPGNQTPDQNSNGDPIVHTGVADHYAFEVHGLTPGSNVDVVIPLANPVPQGGVYRRYTAAGGWGPFALSGSDTFSTTLGSPGNCAGPSDAGYDANLGDLTAGDNCLRIRGTDGGQNDGDGVANGVFVDPGAIVVDPATIPVQPPTQPSPLQASFDTGGGCSIAGGTERQRGFRGDLGLLAIFLAGLSWLRYRRRPKGMRLDS